MKGIPKWARWIATDADGSVHAFENEPKAAIGIGWSSGPGRVLRIYTPPPWRDSLRPVNDNPTVKANRTTKAKRSSK